jgi:NitT/TauT family transport system substrate-binding protein
MHLSTGRLVAAVVAVALSLSMTPAARAADQLSIGQYGVNVETLPWAIALDKGFFQKDGVDIDGYIGGTGGGTSVRNMVASSLPVAQMAPSAVVAGIQSGLDLKIIWASANNLGDLSWVVRADSPYHKISDLKGQKVAFTQPQSTTEMVLRTILSKTKMLDNVTILPTGGINAGILAVDSGAIAAAPIEEPLLLKNPQNYRVLFRVTDYVPHLMFSVGVTTTDFAKSHPDFIRKLMQAHKEAVDYMYAHPADAVAVYQKIWNTSDNTIAQILPRLFKDNYWSDNPIDMQGLQAFLDAMLLVGAIDKPIDAKSIVDPEFLTNPKS